ncbi:ATP-binding protein [Vibrio parahaemolyticus]|uniref:ATP-binding protein n=1 Tax=Vibrio parahaemolyticus TaxID=670 RepID=UPI001FAE1A84|nr:ATP-binding protein [Vibrio parahaemolyticus]EGQ9117509.1 hypothetical protein [Vibrio parahaemolyticus]EIZ1316647.1 ATP-binding protein [Vibrio parahaemolyticus]MCI9724469.1 ATP-binding protein [Vibrio parahaemolyticus]
MSKLIYNSLLAFNKKGDKCFYSKFCNGINIVYGRNTSGKSTLLQLLNYAMGINDSKENLSDVLKEGVVIRLDATLNDKRKIKKINFVRDNSSLIVNIEGESIQRFDGINGNSSYEYRRYKEFFSSLINFNLELESKGEIHPAPLEAAFLPFYISQSVGWVYLRESIGNYRFYKNFKDDYLDYYFNLTNNLDREKIFKLKEDRKQYSQEINFVERYHINHPEIKVAQAISERFKSGAYAYIEEFNQRNEEIIINQKKHIDLVNKKSMLLMRKGVVGKVLRAQNKQRPKEDCCPVCEQALPSTISALYKYKQELNDTNKQKIIIEEQIKKNQSDINSIEKKLEESRVDLVGKYKLLHKLKVSNLTFDTWLDYQSTCRLSEELDLRHKIAKKGLSDIDSQLSEIGEDESLDKDRLKANNLFLNYFKSNARKLGVEIPEDERYRNIYDITSFPLQGVELHKIIMAYHFAFKMAISCNEHKHSLPFVLDAVFKEDIDQLSRDAIYKFLAEFNRDNDQIIFSVADYKKDLEDVPLRKEDIEKVNRIYFNSSANLICIGNAINQKAFLSKFPDKNEIELMEKTVELTEFY